ncbi:MAG: ABC transporter permease [Micrococcales bacterium]
MLAFLAKRLASGVLLLVVISTLAYFLVFTTTDGVALRLLGDMATPEQLHAKEVELGLNRPIFERFFDWASHALQGDFGTSWFTSESIVSALSNRLPVTITIVLVAIAVAAVLAVILGMAAAIKGGWVDRLVQVIAIAGFAVPAFVVAIALVFLFAINWMLLPATGWVPFTDDPGLWAASIILPAASLVVATVASSAQQIRSAIKSVMERDWVRTLRSRGIPEREILFKHVLRSAAPAGLTVLSLQFVGMLGGSVIIENIFALPGIGQLAVSSTSLGDTPVVMGVVVYSVVIVILVNLAVDLINGWLNPKVRVQ